MRTVRSHITARLPAAFVLPARRLARFYFQCVGLPFASLRRGTVVVFHVGRSGSTVLGNLLNQHPKILWDGEIYFKKWAFNRFNIKPFDAERFLRRQMWVAGPRYYGFEIKILRDQHLAIVQMELSEYIEHLKKLGITHYVVLERKNYLRRMISQYVGGKTGRRHIEDETEARLETILLDLDNVGFGTVENQKPLLECFAEINQAYRDLEDLLTGENVLYLDYEADILESGPHVGYEKVCRFLGLKPLPAKVKNRRTNPFRIREIVENYDDLETLLMGTRYEWMLDD